MRPAEQRPAAAFGASRAIAAKWLIRKQSGGGSHPARKFFEKHCPKRARRFGGQRHANRFLPQTFLSHPILFFRILNPANSECFASFGRQVASHAVPGTNACRHINRRPPNPGSRPMALTLMQGLPIDWVYRVFCVSESGWFWSVARRLRADNYGRGVWGASVVMHTAARDSVGLSTGLGR